MQYLCPSCQRPLVSRLGPNCAICGARVPESLLFSKEEKAKIAARERWAEEQRAAERLAETKRKNGVIYIPPMC